MTAPGVQLRRHFLPWHRSLPAQAAAWLAAGWEGPGPLDLAGTLVIVPTRQAGRKLREALAVHAAARAQGVLAPRVVLPEDLLVDGRHPGGWPTASALELRLAWSVVLRAAQLTGLRALFPLDPPEQNFAWAARLARQMVRLQAMLGENGLRMGTVVERAGPEFPEAERWDQLAELEARCDEWLHAHGRLHPQEAAIGTARDPLLPADTTRVVMMATPDPLPLAVRLLEAWARRLPVDVVIFGPAEEPASFDHWGRPTESDWSRRVLGLHFDQQVHLCADPVDQATRIAKLAGRYAVPGQHLGVGVADAEVASALEPRLRAAGISSFNPAGRARSGDALFVLLAAMAGLVPEPAFDAVQRLARCPVFLRWVTVRAGVAADAVLRELDELHAHHLPPNIEAALRHAAKRPAAAAALRGAEEVRRILTRGQFPENAVAAVTAVHAPTPLAPGSPEDESAEAWTEVLREVAAVPAGFADLKAKDWWELALARFGEDVSFPAREAEAVQLLGWLELLWEDIPHLVVAGLNDGFVPEAVAGDAFLPETLRVRLGLKSNEGRRARDAYLLAAVNACRQAAGRLEVLVGKTSAEGDPLRPSRLLLQCDDGELPQRVKALFGPADSRRRMPPWQRAWRLAPPLLPPPSRISVTALRDYLRCPFRFYLKHVLKMEAIDPFKAELDALDFGIICHSALEAFGADEELRESRDPAEIRRFLLEKLEASARERFGRELTLPLRVQLESARQRLARAADVQAQEREAGWVIGQVERKFELVIGAVTVSGKIDRIERHVERGTLRVIDYKTSDRGVLPVGAHARLARREESAPEWTRFVAAEREWVWVDLQLPMYLEAVRPEGGEAALAGYFNLPKALGDVRLQLWDDLGPEWRAAARKCAEGIVGAVSAGRFWPPAEIPPGDDDERFAGLFHQGTAASVDWRGMQ